ncbi:MAG: hypothetical protein OEW87_00215, partial [Flavobacteriaceae bacterium]|nr:hypothetical protein [Flavobacteriaceae bacterium]
NSKYFMIPVISELDEITLVADKDYAYNLLNNLLQKYRKKQSIIESKAFFTLTSSARNIPIEQIEGFYNSKHSISRGLMDLKIKSGRFGQNKSFPFYSLSNILILSDFRMFENSDQILPIYPGNMSPNSIKRKYNVKIEDCDNCQKDEMIISFFPKIPNGRFFYGKLIFNNELQLIKKIELGIKDPVVKAISSINENHVITPNEILLNISYNPLDYEKMQYLEFTFFINYESLSSKETIESHSFLYFYDYHNTFEEPYFTSTINFTNDYDNIIALQATDEFWNANYQFPQSFNEKRSMDFMKKYGYLINYDNNISAIDFKYINPSVISWNKDKRLEWISIKEDATTSKKVRRTSEANIEGTINADKVFHSSSELKSGKSLLNNNGNLNFTYALDQYETSNGQKEFVIRTLFDRNSSFYKYDRSKLKLIYLNLIFDIYEYHRQVLEAQVSDKMLIDEVKLMCKLKYEEASKVVKNMNKETNYGNNYQALVRWNSKIKGKLGIDNFLLIK